MNHQSPSLPLRHVSSRAIPVAIIGIGCRFPGAEGPNAFWEMLCAGRSGISKVPKDRWSAEAFYDPHPEAIGRARTKWGGFLPDVAGFDAEFFGISAREAESMDPQQRILLQVVWEGLEDAGIPPERLAGKPVGVFVGISVNDFANLNRKDTGRDTLHAGTGGALSIVANRVSHRFDLRGPSVSVDTACSSSLVAADMACRSLADGTSEVALAAGVNLMLDPAISVLFSKANMMSPTGRCFSFDERADGYVRGEGVGVVVLKTLHSALADGDRIYAVIHGTAVNQDGRTSTITVPNAEAQERLLREVLDNAGMKPDDVTLVEAHGTGTPVGDPIEAHAIGSVFGKERQDGAPVTIGALKSAIGHLESAAGIAGIIKAALCVDRGKIPPNLNFARPNPNIPVAELNLSFPTVLADWRPGGKARIAAVNSFGFGGTNACALIGEAPRPAKVVDRSEETIPQTSRPTIVPLSAANDESLKKAAANLAAALDASPERVEDIGSTLALRRAHLPRRLAI
ncbi:MAG: polyketide synthase, partial [Rhodospirillaceae bacterium]|nr:polyketide synthase [Rhodospirillaceae bacterium]